MMKRILLGSIAAVAALSLAACGTFGEHASPAASPAAQTSDLSDAGADNSTPSIFDMRTHNVHDSAFPAGSRNSSPD